LALPGLVDYTELFPLGNMEYRKVLWVNIEQGDDPQFALGQFCRAHDEKNPRSKIAVTVLRGGYSDNAMVFRRSQGIKWLDFSRVADDHRVLFANDRGFTCYVDGKLSRAEMLDLIDKSLIHALIRD